MTADKRRAGIALLAGACLLVVAIPVLAASPSPSASPATASPATASPEASETPTLSPEDSAAPATASPSPTNEPATATPATSSEGTAQPVKPDATGEPEETAKPDKTQQRNRGPETTISLSGTVNTAVDGKGRPAYSMTVDGTTWELSAGPPWFWGDKNPLNAYVGKSVTVAGTTRAGETEIDVETVDGEALRAPGKPPWAGGPWVVGSSHPGWKDWMAEGKPGKGLGRDSAPGQLKKASPAP